MRPAALVLAAALTVAACSGSPQPRLYVLTPAERPASVGATGSPGVGVGPVTLAPHLDRPQIVSRQGAEVHLGELDRWAEPLQDAIARLLAENLGAMLATDRIWTWPWRPAVPARYQVSIEFFRFDRAGGDAVLAARWTLFDGDGLLAARRFEHREPPVSPEAAATVEALARGLAALSREIALEIAEHSD